MLPPGGSPPLPPPAERAVDRLSDLPSDILEKLILARLPASDVVRTSALSRPWRRRWETVPGLDIELDGVRDWSSAARYLERCQGPVGRVSISIRAVLGGGGWVIRAPNLRRLELCLWMGSAGLWELGPLPNLECARIFLYDTAEQRDYVKVFTAISNVRELHLGNFNVVTQEAAMNRFKDLLSRFKNLRILRLDGNFNEYPTNDLLYLSPYLETVEIKEWY